MVKTMYVVESTFEHCGLTCVVVMRPNFYRCGYVGVPKESSLFGKRMNDHLEINKADIGDHHVSGTFPLFLTALDSDPRIRLDAYFHCHGGITYSDGGDGSDYPIKSDLWWFGFDCGHAGDAQDYESAKRLFADDPEALRHIKWCEELDRKHPIESDVVRTKEYVESECRTLSEELAAFEKGENNG